MLNIGYKQLGFGSEKVFVIHGWSCDHTCYTSLFPFLDTDQFTFFFVDLRGYGISKEIVGNYSLDEVRDDLLSLATHLKADTFHLIGHGMGGLFAQKIAADMTKRVLSVIAITPVPACGCLMDGGIYQKMYRATQPEEAMRESLSYLLGSRSYKQWIDYNVQRWKDCCDWNAARGYLKTFVESDISEAVQEIETPFAVILGDKDGESYSDKMVENTFAKYYPNLAVHTLLEAGHYPMQEVPVQLALMINRYLSEKKCNLSVSV